MIDDISSLFEMIDKNNIIYYILRDYNNKENIINTKDIDIYVDKKFKKEIHTILINNGWNCPKINDNKFPHVQYYKLYQERIAKIDIVYDFYFGNNNFALNINKFDINNYRTKDGFNIAEEKIALIVLLLHIIYDKEYISKKNKDNLKYMMNEYYKKYGNNDYIYNLALEIEKYNVEKVIQCKGNIKEYSEKFILKNTYRNFLLKIKRKINHYLFKIYKKYANRTIAIIGVDGSGKSSIISELVRIYDGKLNRMYMGEKEYKINMLDKLIGKKNCSIIEKIIRRILIKIEPFYRYRIAKRFNIAIIYDRYVDDVFINCPNIINTFLYKIIFPKPKIKIYLHCSIDISLSRKDDITDKEIFSKMKKRYDDYYLNKKRKNVYSIDTGIYSQQDSLNKIIDIINEKLPNSLF